MYTDEFIRTPRNEDDFWSLADQILKFVAMDFGVPIEDRDQALTSEETCWYSLKYRKSDDLGILGWASSWG